MTKSERPAWAQYFKTKIFLDSGDPEETKKIIDILGFLDGQTTNPTLIRRNPRAQTRLTDGKKFSKEELLGFYREIVEEISKQIPDGSVSIETYVDRNTTFDEILEQAQKMNSWILNAHIKIPICKEGLKAAQIAVASGIKVNMTLCFTQEQAAAVYAATQGAHRGEVFVSPFVGRLDDIGLMGTDLVDNVHNMFYDRIHIGDGHVMNLAASIRNLSALQYFLKNRGEIETTNSNIDIVTCPFNVLLDLSKERFIRPHSDFCLNRPELKRIKFVSHMNFARNWQEMNYPHPLTDKGIDTFSKDWNILIEEEKLGQQEVPVHLL